jgi:hypothetical protein
MEKQPNSSMCFLCGINNPIGRKLSFYTDGEDRCIAHFWPRPEHQGYPRHLHGGIISTLLDVPTQISMHSDPLSVGLSITGRSSFVTQKPRFWEPRFFSGMTAIAAHVWFMSRRSS